MQVMSRLIVSMVVLALSAIAKPPHSFPTLGRVIREDPRLDALLSQDARIEALASGFEWAEGPVWDEPASGLLFSDIPRNTIFRWTAQRGAELWMKPSGFTGIGDYSAEPGSNGLLLDSRGRLILMEHGDRRVSLWEAGRGKVTLADNFEGKRLNSPNDVALKSNGDLYFTDPPYGLPKKADDPSRELDFSGVYRYSQGKLTLLTKELSRPNGIAFSPDEKTLYVSNSDPQRAIWMAYPVNEDGTLGTGLVFADVTAMAAQLPGLPDGMKVDREGNLWAAGPGGIHVMAPDGKRLGRIETGEATSNCAWGDDGSTLYITADMYLCRIHTKTHGAAGRYELRK
jgi:gluconolactonase